jgi:YegS/Rv2252/BmrU family lipid kinase
MYYFIINPKSRSGAAKKMWKQLRLILDVKQVEYSVFFTRYQGDAKKYAHRLTADSREKTLVVVGGDGTLNEVVSGICDFDRVTLGYIPTGSSNDFARSIGISANPEEALNGILSASHSTKVDIGHIASNGKTRNFIVSAGFGMDAAICHQVSISRLKYILNCLGLGKLTYVLLALQQLFLCQPSHMLITVDGKSYEYDKVYMTAIMNMPYEGGGCMFAPKARWNDQQLDLCVIEGLGKLKILCLLPTVFFGKHILFDGIHVLRGRSIAMASRKARIVHTDGETFNPKKTLTASCNVGQLRIIY